MFFISSLRASRQYIVPVSRSISRACLRVFRSSTPNLCILLWYRLFTADSMHLRHFRTGGAHHTKAGSFIKSFISVYSATRIGYASLRSESRSYKVEPPFHETQSFHPGEVILLRVLPLCSNVQSSVGTAVESFLWSMMLSIITW